MSFLQGNTYDLPVLLSDDNGLIDISLISEVEFYIGNIRKTYPDECTYDDATGCFNIPLTQQETFSLGTGPIQYQARVKFVGGMVKGTLVKTTKVYGSISKVVL